jgi:cytochrome c6
MNAPARAAHLVVVGTIAGTMAAGPLAMAQTTATTETAASAYKANCVICHADDGSGTPLGIRLKAKDLRNKEVQEKPSSELAQTIRAGKGNMPAFGTRMDSEQIDKLIEYVRQKKSD